MSTSLRCWIAASALALSALVLTTGLGAEEIGAQAGLVLLAVFLNAWIIAVGEHAAGKTGALRVPRFPLGGRLLRAYPGLQGQLMHFILIAGLITGSWSVAGWALLVLAVLSLEVVRRAAWVIVPVGVVVHALLSMQEFQSLGDLVGTARGWVTGSVLVGVQALVVCGPLLRVDTAGRLGLLGRPMAMLASLPGYLGAFWVATRSPLAGQFSSLQTLLFTLLVGGVVQSLMLSLGSWAGDIRSRPSEDLSDASPRGVGMALLPMLLPAVAPLLPLFVPAAPGATGAPAAWTGLCALLLILPAVPAAAWIAAALDRLDGREAWMGLSVAGCALVAWLAFCPALLGRLYAEDGPAARLHASFPVGGAAVLAKTVETTPATAAAAADDEPLARRRDATSGRELLLYDLPATQLARALAALMLAATLLSVRWMRHARPLQRPASWLEFYLLAGAAGAAGWWLLPRQGLPAAILGMAGACALLLFFDLFHSEVLPPEPPEVPEDGEPEPFDLAPTDISPDRGAPEIIT
jgi:hypothetical protein